MHLGGRLVLSMWLAAVTVAANTEVDAAVLVWMQRTLDDWEGVCRQDLHISPDPLPWMIFYDSTHAWHVRPELKRLPTRQRTNHTLRFAGEKYPVFEVRHTEKVWVPGRDGLDLTARGVALPYDSDSKVVLVVGVPQLQAMSAGVPLSKDLADFFGGATLHELTHTRQMRQLLPVVRELQKRYRFPKNIDDNLIQTTFAGDEDFHKMHEEVGRHTAAALLSNNDAIARENARKAVVLLRQRQERFFTGRREGWNELEEAFLTLEGAAMWVQYRHARRVAPAGQPWQETLGILSQRCDSWSQMEGIALFLLLDRFDSQWQPKFFAEFAAPSVVAVLEGLLSR